MATPGGCDVDPASSRNWKKGMGWVTRYPTTSLAATPAAYDFAAATMSRQDQAGWMLLEGRGEEWQLAARG